MSNDIVKECGSEAAFSFVTKGGTTVWGLTKREYIATQLMAGYLSEGFAMGTAADLAVQASDLLLIKLNTE